MSQRRSQEEYGGYYAWGETSEKSEYDEDTYFDPNYTITTDIAGTECDVAGNNGYYWSSSPYAGDSYDSYGLYFDSDGGNWYYDSWRGDGFSVRPVSE